MPERQPNLERILTQLCTGQTLDEEARALFSDFPRLNSIAVLQSVITAQSVADVERLMFHYYAEEIPASWVIDAQNIRVRKVLDTSVRLQA